MAAGWALILGLANAFGYFIPASEYLIYMAYFGVFINLLLAYFNLLPIPPLDGSHVLAHLLPPHMARRYREFGRWGVLVLLIVVFALPRALSVVLSPVTGAMGLLDSFLRIWV